MDTVLSAFPFVNLAPSASLRSRLADAFFSARENLADADARHLLDTVTKVPDELKDVSARLGKMTSHRLRNEQIARYLEQQNLRLGSGDNKKAILAAKLRDCFRSVAFAPDGHMNGGDFGAFAVRSCNQYRLCGNCASRRAGRYAQLYMGRVSELLRLYPAASVYTLVFTIPSGEYIYDRFWCLSNGLRTLVRRATKKGTVTQFRNILAGVASVEIKRGAGTGQWHPHTHALVVSSAPLDEDKLRYEWCKYTGGTNLFISCHGRMEDEESAGAVCEVLKYNVKLNELAYDDLWLVQNAFSRKRLLSSWGLFRGLELSEDDGTDEPAAPVSARWYHWNEHESRYIISK